MTPFLKQIAAMYVERETADLMDCCFVFPNKRSGVFFKNYLEEPTAGRPLILPRIMTIGELMSSFSPLAEASRLDRLFLLYEEYSKISNEIADFDRFLFWGEMIMADFDDVDLNLADASRLFVNLKRYREISSFYLTPEQEEILSRYWGAKFSPHSPLEFWSHIRGEEDGGVEKKFLRLWEVLGPLYDNYRASLLGSGLGSRGMIARDAVERLKTRRVSGLPFRRYIFVGFNVLSVAEIKLFDILKNLGVADFYWDVASDAIVAEGNKASRFMKRNLECFPQKYALESPSGAAFPSIRIIGVPSGVGQAKDAGNTLRLWVKDGIIKTPDNAIDTAVVLPDESLLVPVTRSLPEEITAFNVTMGFPLRATSFASFIALIVSLQLRSQFSHDKWYFFHEDVKALLSHPLLRKIDREGCDSLLTAIRDRRLFLVEEGEIAKISPSMLPFFKSIYNHQSVDEVYGYFRTILTGMLRTIDSEDEVEDEEKENELEGYFVRSYLDALDELKSAIDRRNVRMQEITFIQLLQKAIASTTVSFAGEPLKGLQIMGMLETRALDFENLIILSMNESVFPRKHYTRSFIPDNLRRSYGLPTSDFQESIFAYSFYRLISRASNVVLYYDARNVSGRNSEMSRYIAQLLYLFPESAVDHELLSYSLTASPDGEISVAKTPGILARLREFTPEGGRRTLSASSINDYINCPLSFYLKRLCRLDLDEDVIDYMDAGTYGSILHASMEHIYNDCKGSADEVKVTEEMLDRILKSPVYLDKVITFSVNEYYNKLGKDCPKALTGESKVLGHVMKHFISLLLEEEKKIAPFDFIAAEYRVLRTFRISPELSINIQQYIDRIDRVYPPGHYGEESLGRIRIVDYKTGSDNVDFNSFDQLFSNEDQARRKAIVQLLFYCNAYAEEKGYDGPITPMIYQLKTLSTMGLQPIVSKLGVEPGKRGGGVPLMDYREVNNDFMERFHAVIEEIFDPAKPFVQAPDEHNCKFCTLTSICRRSR